MEHTDGALERILNSPGSMQKIAELAQSLKAEMQETSGESADSEAGQTETSGISDPVIPGVPDGMGVSGVLSGLNANPAVMRLVTAAASSYGQSDKRTRLLEALRPFTHGENVGTIDRAINAVRIARTAKAVLNTIGGGERFV